MNSTLKSIRIRIKETDKIRLLYLFDKFNYIFRNFTVSEPEYEPGTNFVKYVITVNNMSNYYIIIETLAINGFTVESNDEKVNEIIESVKEKYREDLRKYAESVEVVRKINKTHDSLDDLIDGGNYKELIKVSKDITYSTETLSKAKSGILLTVTNAIIKNVDEVAKYRFAIKKTIENLLKIASDTELKLYNCNMLMEQAGVIAIELSSKYEESVHYLIKISNLRNIDNLLNLKAASKFGEIVLSDPGKYENDIRIAVRELNTRWLDMAYDSAKHKLSEEENELLIKCVNMIKSRRS